MLLALEIWLSVSAWRAGWKGWVLAPWAVCFLVGAVVAAGLGSSGDTGSLTAVGLVTDLVLIASLAVMKAARKTEAADKEQTEPVLSSQETVQAQALEA